MANVTAMTPTRIVQAMDGYVIGQTNAKRALAIAIRDRWRIWQFNQSNQGSVLRCPNIVLSGPTGSGKTRSVEVLHQRLGFPIYITPVTRFSQVGYQGDNLKSIIPAFIEANIHNPLPEWYTSQLGIKETVRKEDNALSGEEVLQRLLKANVTLREDVLSLVASAKSGIAGLGKRTRAQILKDPERCLSKLMDAPYQWWNHLDPLSKIPFLAKGYNITAGQAITVKDFIDVALNNGGAENKVMDVLFSRYGEKYTHLSDTDAVDENLAKEYQEKLRFLETFGIVFLDEFDKIADKSGDNVGGFGVQRELLTLVEGMTITTKYGEVNTRNILFIAAGAFEAVDRSGIIPELEGRFPIKVELAKLTADDINHILSKTKDSQLIQIQQKLSVENINVSFTEDGVNAIADTVAGLNQGLYLGARRIDDILSRVTQDLSYNVEQYAGKTVVIDGEYVKKALT